MYPSESAQKIPDNLMVDSVEPPKLVIDNDKKAEPDDSAA